MSCFRSWLGFPAKTADAIAAVSLPAGTTPPPPSAPAETATLACAAPAVSPPPPSLPEPVAAILLIYHDDKRELRSVFQVGEACFVWTHDWPDTAKRVLPHGRLGEEGPRFVNGWEPVSPINWQPPNAETAHERIARLETENARLSERVAAHTRLLQSIATSAREATERTRA